MQQRHHSDFFLDLDEDLEMFDFLSLRDDQRLEYAKEYNSIIPEPLGSRLRPRKDSGKVSHTVDQRPAWNQPCKLATPESYSLQWQHVNVSQLEAFPSTLRGAAANSPSPSRKRNQPDDTYTGQGTASEQIAAMRAPNAVSQADALPAEQQHWQSSMQSGSLSPASNAMTRLSNAAKGSRPDNVTSAMKQGVGSCSIDSAGHNRGSSSDAIPMHAKHDLETPAVPVRPTSTQRHQAMHGRYAAQQVSNSPAKQDAASCSHATRAPKASRGYSHEQEAFNQIQPGHKGKQTQAGAQQQPRCSQMVDAVGSKSCKVVKSSGGKVDSGNEKLQRQNTLLGNWVRWETPVNAQQVAGKAGSPNHASALAPRTPTQPKEAQRAATSHSTSLKQQAKQQQQQQLPPAAQRHIMPRTGKGVQQDSGTLLQRSRQHGSPDGRWQHSFSPEQMQQQCMQQQSLKRDAVVDSVVHQTGCELMQRCGPGVGLEGDRCQPSVRYCLTSAEPAIGAGVWEEQATRQWLQELSLGLTAAEESAPLLDNQLRNGVLLCDLAGVLEGRIVWGVDRQPKSLQRARANIMAGLGQLGMLTAQTCPKGLVHEVEHILQGRQASIWGLLNHLRVTHPAARVVAMQMKAEVADRTNAQTAHPLKPDRCTATAVSEEQTCPEAPHAQHGVTFEPRKSAQAQHIVAFKRQEPAEAQHIVSLGPRGSISCSVPGVAHARHPSAAVQDGVKTTQQCNMRQASPVSGRHVKQACPYHQRDTITVSLVSKPHLLDPPGRAVSPQRSQRGCAAQQCNTSPDAASSKPYVRMVAIGPGYSKPVATASAQCDRQCSSQSQRQQHQSDVRAGCCSKPTAASAQQERQYGCQLKEQQWQQQQQQGCASPARCPDPAAASVAGRKAALAQLRMTRRRQQSSIGSKQQVQQCMSARDRQGSGQQWSSRRKTAKQPTTLNDLELVSWAQSKGLTQLTPGMLLEPSFADGRLLCRLVELLRRCTLAGIEWHSPSIAASRHNIAKAMAELKKKPSMSLQHLWQAAEIVNADPGCIQALLNDVSRAYK